MRYISDRVISFSLPINGNDKRFRFTPVMNRGSIYVTNSKDEIVALEKSPMFNTIYKRVESQSISSEESSEIELTSVGSVTNWQEAKDYLKENFKIDARTINTPESIQKCATANNVVFPNLK